MTSVAVRCDPSRQHLDGPLRSFADGTEVPILRPCAHTVVNASMNYMIIPVHPRISRFRRHIIICAP